MTKTLEDINKFMQESREHGLECGVKIASVAREMHPNALVIVPLYRSCIVVEQSEKEKKEGICAIYTYADPHWCGGEIDIENLSSERFHREFVVQGDREGPMIIDKSHDCGNVSSDGEDKFMENDDN